MSALCPQAAPELARAWRAMPPQGWASMTASIATPHADELHDAINTTPAHALDTAESRTGIQFHDVYLAALEHQRRCSPLFLDLAGQRPSRSCLTAECLTRSAEQSLADAMYPAVNTPDFDVCRRWAWSIPNQAALDAIAEAAPRGVVEIGAGSGYWAYELTRRGVDVIAYDIDPATPADTSQHRWHVGFPWHPVRFGAEPAAAAHPDRTLLVCMPERGSRWAARGIAAFHAAGGERVVHIGEGPGGMTGDPSLWDAIGLTTAARSGEPEHAGSNNSAPLFRPVREVALPRWAGVHDQLTVCDRDKD